MPRIQSDQLPPTVAGRRLTSETRPAHQPPASPHQHHGDGENPDTADDPPRRFPHGAAGLRQIFHHRHEPVALAEGSNDRVSTADDAREELALLARSGSDRVGACAATPLRREVSTMTNRFLREIARITAGQFQTTRRGEQARHVKLLSRLQRRRKGERPYERRFLLR